MKTLLIISLIVCLVVALAMILVPSGPRITTIERRTEREDREDRDDA